MALSKIEEHAKGQDGHVQSGRDSGEAVRHLATSATESWIIGYLITATWDNHTIAIGDAYSTADHRTDHRSWATISREYSAPSDSSIFTDSLRPKNSRLQLSLLMVMCLLGSNGPMGIGRFQAGLSLSHHCSTGFDLYKREPHESNCSLSVRTAVFESICTNPTF
ncbi:hypothetical protein PanWU01x14_208290 [Parasponia andersonii]|uniref:Uncharacterized protein n=1 Tax=Parasponia andersonii TaxID=3476 RepID=A0A2P5BUW1_PARAD|nr:hypothetical protein PanWU01x14_208290 [Parasponia andersonii]